MKMILKKSKYKKFKNRKMKEHQKNQNVFFENEEARKVFEELDLDLGNEPMIFSIDDGSGTTDFEKMISHSNIDYERIEIEVDTKDLK